MRPNTWLTGFEALSARLAPCEPTTKSRCIAILVADGFDRAQVNGVRTTPLKAGIAKPTSPRKQGGLGPNLRLLLVAHRDMSISPDYVVLVEDEGIALCGLFIIDP
ncbi:uncharacterized protein BXZ73DRAFT_104794 [Epithele typhae]|uniref:uncharacterized protein n=1 Tax=Epithele typhae TaxID=378194 RepID=UPI0020072C6C|nr:uncharacterized protein BXZ73DRAFT_104794 [Epithele typhae]KAH9919975.1 hypothetical protein BXZ73DRAFT_104794 [Epithele typhae]